MAILRSRQALSQNRIDDGAVKSISTCGVVRRSDVIGKPIVRVIGNLAFARNGPRVSYATSISIADARALLPGKGGCLAAYANLLFGHFSQFILMDRRRVASPPCPISAPLPA